MSAPNDVAALVERLRFIATARAESNQRAGRTGKEWRKETEIEWVAATTIAALQSEVERAKEERHLADNALVDRYRDPKTGSFVFPTDVAAIVRRLDAAEAERDRVLYVIHHADISLVGLAFPDDGMSVCTGTSMHKLTAANRLKDCGLVMVENSPAGPLVRWAPGRARSASRKENTP